jgi:hypothetical protein
VGATVDGLGYLVLPSSRISGSSSIYPDRENRFPNEPGFDETFRQQLLQVDAPATKVEEDFWASTDLNSSLFDWKFPDPPNTIVFLSDAVQSGTEPITYV